MELNNMNLDDLLSVTDNALTGKLFENAEVEVTINKDSSEEEINRNKTMAKLAEYESCQNKLGILNKELEDLDTELNKIINEVKLNHKELIDKINSKTNEIKEIESEQEKIKVDLLPLQRNAFKYNTNDKTFNYNKIQSTYVEPTEKNSFDLKKFREEQKEFWNTNLNVLEPYSKITEVSDYIKITISKK